LREIGRDYLLLFRGRERGDEYLPCSLVTSSGEELLLSLGGEYLLVESFIC